MFNKLFPENRAVYEKMWNNTVEPDRTQMTILNGACALHAYITEATDVNSEYVIKGKVVPLQA
jgi:hypothetical protein